MNPIRNTALALLALTLAGCNTFYAEAEQPQVCVTLAPQTFTITGSSAAPVAEAAAATTLAGLGAQVDLGLSSWLPDFMTKGSSDSRILHLLSFSVAASGAAGANLDWLQSVQITVQKGTTTPVVLASWTPGSGQTGHVGPLLTSVTVPGSNQDLNLSDFLSSNGTLVTAVTGTVDSARLPAGSTWTGQVGVCFYAKIKKTYAELINGN